MKTPDEIFKTLGNRGEYAALPNITVEEIASIQSDARADLERELQEAVELLRVAEPPFQFHNTEETEKEWLLHLDVFLARHRKEGK